MKTKFNLILLLVALVATFVGAATALYLRPAPEPLVLRKDPREPELQGLMWPNPKEVAPFQLTDHDGRPFDLERLEGKWSFLFFGYTHCPDVCPMALDTMKRAMRKLEGREEAADTQVVFVSVDPARDTPKHLKSYVEYFDPDFIGVTGPEDELKAMTRQLGIIYDLHQPDGSGEYLVDHTAAILLTDPEGRVVAIFSAPHRASDIADRFQAMRDYIEKHS